MIQEKNKKLEPITMGEIQNFLLDDGWVKTEGHIFNLPSLNEEWICEEITGENPDKMWCNDTLTSEELVDFIKDHSIWDSRIGEKDLVNEFKIWGWIRSDYYFTKNLTTIFFLVKSGSDEEELQNDSFWCEIESGNCILQNEHLYFFSDLIKKIDDSVLNEIKQQKINEHKKMIKELETTHI